MIFGFIVSDVRSEMYIDPPYTFPMLFIHHKKDRCAHTTLGVSYKNFAKVKAVSQSPTEFVHVTGGLVKPRDPCRNGHHMYYAAWDEAAKYIHKFLLKIYPWSKLVENSIYIQSNLSYRKSTARAQKFTSVKSLYAWCPISSKI